ncbi:CHAT domain-containing protein [Pelatocladus sp. BLCC-F211]|uniref:CHAT domain-containing protein n=1 Tax=Pelatocladus sp. BLCC-F211 TaxID=3342752 RepID=UPI0035BAE90F
MTIKTILFLAANPLDTTHLRLDQEFREIQVELERSKRREQFKLEQRWAVRLIDIRRAMLDFNPQIIHFAGHGGGEKGLAFEDESGYAKLIDGDTLASLFELFAGSLECIVLNGCYTQIQAEAIAQHIPYVVGMDKAIGDKAAIEFAAGFYSALGAGKSYEFAYKLGCTAINLSGIPENLTPKLHKKEGVKLDGIQTEQPAKNDDNFAVIRIWKEKLAFLQNEEAITANPAQKFELEQQIKECKQKIKELGG